MIWSIFFTIFFWTIPSTQKLQSLQKSIFSHLVVISNFIQMAISPERFDWFCHFSNLTWVWSFLIISKNLDLIEVAFENYRHNNTQWTTLRIWACIIFKVLTNCNTFHTMCGEVKGTDERRWQTKIELRPVFFIRLNKTFMVWL